MKNTTQTPGTPQSSTPVQAQAQAQAQEQIPPPLAATGAGTLSSVNVPSITPGEAARRSAVARAYALSNNSRNRNTNINSIANSSATKEKENRERIIRSAALAAQTVTGVGVGVGVSIPLTAHAHNNSASASTSASNAVTVTTPTRTYTPIKPKKEINVDADFAAPPTNTPKTPNSALKSSSLATTNHHEQKSSNGNGSESGNEIRDGGLGLLPPMNKVSSKQQQSRYNRKTLVASPHAHIPIGNRYSPHTANTNTNVNTTVNTRVHHDRHDRYGSSHSHSHTPTHGHNTYHHGHNNYEQSQHQHQGGYYSTSSSTANIIQQRVQHRLEEVENMGDDGEYAKFVRGLIGIDNDAGDGIGNSNSNGMDQEHRHHHLHSRSRVPRQLEHAYGGSDTNSAMSMDGPGGMGTDLGVRVNGDRNGNGNVKSDGNRNRNSSSINSGIEHDNDDVNEEDGDDQNDDEDEEEYQLEEEDESLEPCDDDLMTAEGEDEGEGEDGEKDANSSSIMREEATSNSVHQTQANNSGNKGDDELTDLEPISDYDYDFDELDLDPIAMEEELGGLLEEDMEAAVNSLIQQDMPGDINLGLPMPTNMNMNMNMPMTFPMGMPPLHSHSYDSGTGPGSTGKSASASNSSFQTNSNAATPMAVSSSNPHMHTPQSAQPISMSNIRTTPSTHTHGHPHTPSKAATSAATSASKFPTPSHRQVLHLQKLMNQHYQILLQQATLAVRAAHGNKYKNSKSSSNSSTGSGSKRKRQENFFCCGETADDLAGIVDGAVTMLQDLGKNRKDAIRYSIQMRRVNSQRQRSRGDPAGKSGGRRPNDKHSGAGVVKIHGFYPPRPPSAARAILADDEEGDQKKDNGHHHGNGSNDDHLQEGILTRSAFTRTLRESDYAAAVNPTHGFGMSSTDGDIYDSSNSKLGANTTFGVRGLARLDETFAAIDNSLSAQSATMDPNSWGNSGASGGRMKSALNRLHDADNIFLEPHHGRACEILLRHAGADYDRNIVCGYKELSNVLTYPSEVMGRDVGMPMSEDQQKSLRSNRLQFTCAEDNLLLRGVNLYGEKEWMFISDRFLPDRSVSIIAQRYWRLCLLIYRGHNIYIDHNGSFKKPPLLPNGADDFDERAIAQTLKPVKQPVAFGLYRWSMEEDILLLKAVPLMGRLFAEIGKRFIPYRDRGALRKRYQVLERRVKGAMKRDKKLRPIVTKPAKKPLPVLSKPIKRLKPATTTKASSYTAPPQTFIASTKANNYRNAPTAKPTYPPPPPRRELVPSTIVSNIHPPPSSDSYSSAALGKVIDGEWSQLGRIIAQDSGNSKISPDDRYPVGGIPPHSATEGAQYYQQYPGPSSTNVSSAPQYLPTMSFNEGSLSGLSMLGNSVLGETNQSGTGGAKQKGESIMKSVMKRTNESTSFSKAARTPRDSTQGTNAVAKQSKHDSTSNLESFGELLFRKNGRDSSPPVHHQINSNIQFPNNLSMSQTFDHSLMAPPELDAISVLNQMQMSNSSIGLGPTKKFSTPSSPFKPPRSSDLERTSDVIGFGRSAQPREASKQKKSFLEKVKQKVVASKKK